MTSEHAREVALEAELHELARQWLAIDYRASGFNRLLRNRGGLGTVRYLLAKSGVSPGFLRLADAGKLEWTVEFVVLRREYGSLLTPEERAIARRRLVEHGMPRDDLPLEPY